MSFNIEVQGGKSYLLPTGGKYCPEDIAIAAIGGQTEGMYCWAQYDTPPYEVPMDKVVTKNMTIAKGGHGYVIKSTSGSSGWGINRLDMPLVKKVVFYPQDTSLYMQIGVMKDSNNINQGQANFGMAFYTDGGAIKHHRNGAYVASYGTFTLSDVFTIEFTDTEMQVYKNGALLFTDNTFNSTYTKLSFECYQGNATIGSFEFGEKAESIGYVLSDNLNAYPQDGYHTDGYYYKLMENDIAWDERGQYAWTKMESADTAPMGYVVTNTEDAYPNDGFADDGYYYTKVSATKITPKRANGTVTQSDKLIEINGLNFKPFAAFVFCPSINNGTLGCNSWGYIDENGKIYGYYMRGGYKGSSSLEVMDNGFKILASDTMGSGTYYWHAIGY